MADFTSDFPSVARLRLSVWEASYDAAANTSVVGWRMTLEHRTSYGYRAFNDCPWSVALGGQTVQSGNNANYNLSAGVVIQVSEGTTTIWHDADGTKSLSVEGWYDGKTPIGSASVLGYLPLTTLHVAPPAPTGLSGVRASDTQVNLTWANNPGARAPYSGIEVQRWATNSQTWAPFASLGGTATSLTDTSGVAAGVGYQYRVRATNSAGVSEWAYSALVVARPAAPTSLTASRVGETRIDMSWANPSTQGAPYSQSRIERWDNITGTWTLLHTAAMTSYSNTGGIVGDRAYQYRIANTNASGQSAWTYTAMLYGKPQDATSVTASRVSDAQINVSWANPTATYRPYGWSVVERWDNVSGVWSVRATVTGASWSDTAVQADRQYRYRIANRNTWGTAAAVLSGYVYTSPAAPTNVVAVRDGTNIKISWTNNSTIATHWDVEVSSGGAAFVLVAAATVNPYTHVSPDPTKTHVYRVRAVRTGVLAGPYSANSNTVVLLTPPNAPTLLAPIGTWHTAVEELAFSWRHNTVDSSPQSAYELRYRKQGSADAYVTVTGTTAQTWTMPASTLTNGQAYEWQVRTKGQHADYSAWSALATWGFSARPTVTITSPGSTWVSNRAQFAWTYADAEGLAQSAATIRLLDASGTELWSVELSGTAASYEHPIYRYTNTTSHTVRVSVRDGHGLWSAEASRAFVVQFREPAQPLATAQWVSDDGAALVQITNPTPTPEQETTVRNELWRVVDPAVIALWERLAAMNETDEGYPALRAEFEAAYLAAMELVSDSIPLDGTITDPIPSLTTTLYRILAVSALDTSVWSDVVQMVAPGPCWIYLNAGPGLATIARWRGAPVSGNRASHDKTLHHFSGRSIPVEYVGQARHRAYSIGGALEHLQAHSTQESVLDVLHTAGPAFYRDPLGRREWVSISDASFADRVGRSDRSSFSATATRTAAPS